MPDPLAFFITWTTHGTWMHGDRRGSVDREHNSPGSSYIAPDARRAGRDRMAMDTDAVVLDPGARRVVEAGIREHAEHKSWIIHALSVRSNHVHVVITASSERPERVMGGFKAWATRALRTRALADPTGRVWTRHGSTRWINDERSLLAAIDYVTRFQDRSARYNTRDTRSRDP